MEGWDGGSDDGQVAFDGGIDKADLVSRVGGALSGRVVEEVDGAHAEDAEDGDAGTC